MNINEEFLRLFINYITPIALGIITGYSVFYFSFQYKEKHYKKNIYKLLLEEIKLDKDYLNEALEENKEILKNLDKGDISQDAILPIFTALLRNSVLGYFYFFEEFEFHKISKFYISFDILCQKYNKLPAKSAETRKDEFQKYINSLNEMISLANEIIEMLRKKF